MWDSNPQPRILEAILHLTPPPGAHLQLFWQKNKFDQKNFYIKETVDQVPEKALRTHRNKPSRIISGWSVETMGIFPSCKNSWTLCKLRLLGASYHPDKGVFHFSSQILAMSARSESILDHIADYL